MSDVRAYGRRASAVSCADEDRMPMGFEEASGAHLVHCDVRVHGLQAVQRCEEALGDARGGITLHNAGECLSRVQALTETGADFER